MSHRLVTGTVNEDDRVTFNEVSIKGDLPDRLVLMAIDPVREGIHLWVPPYREVANLIKPQAEGYSVSIRYVSISCPPAELGAGYFFPSDRFSDERWEKLLKARTRALKKAGEEAIADLFGL